MEQSRRSGRYFDRRRPGIGHAPSRIQNYGDEIGGAEAWSVGHPPLRRADEIETSRRNVEPKHSIMQRGLN